MGQLEDLAFQLAEGQVAVRGPGARPSLLDRLGKQGSRLRDAYEYFRHMPAVERALSYAAEWMLDNFYVVEQALRQIREDMPEGYYRQLPKLSASHLEGYPRVYALAREVIGYCESHLDLDRVTRFVRAYQEITPLTMGELWALPTMLRLGVVACLTQAVDQVVGRRDLDDAEAPLLISLPPNLSEDAIVANCILSLRMLAVQDWKAFFESVSWVEQVLRRDPIDVYKRMDFETRDRYRGIIEEVALATGRDEGDVAWEAVRLAEEAQGGAEHQSAGSSTSLPGSGGRLRAAHVGFYLLDAGRTQLEARLGYRPPASVRLRRWLLKKHPNLSYLGGIGLLTGVILLVVIGYARIAGGTTAQLIGAGLLTLLPAVTIAVSAINWLVTHIVPPQVLPKMDFQEAIPAEYSTMVVVPALVGGSDEAESLLRQLELHYLGNQDTHMRLALLTDFADAPQQHMPGEDVVLEQLKVGIQALNRKYSRRVAGPFYLFHRDRQWNAAENCWMGWERKRGKLVEFNRLLGRGETSYNVQIGDLGFLFQVRYVITLDADTLLPRDGARRLVAALAHPLNQAEFDPTGSTVIAGYTVLQPRVEIKPTVAGRSLFTRIFAGDVGLDLYTRAISDVYQDLFGEGIYAGKGIYDVVAFERSLGGRVPDNSLLSHDLFEGIHGRVGLMTDVILYEDYPSHYLAYTRRLHRWVRGDWQLLPWLLPRVPHADGGRASSSLSILDRWKVLDNLRRSLLSPGLLALLVAGWLWLPGQAALWTLVGTLALAMPIFASATTLLIRGLGGETWSGVGGAFWAVRMAIFRWLLALTFLPYEALLILDAIACTLVRLVITRRRLLQWTTSAHTIRLFGRETKLGLLWKQMGGASFLALALAWMVFLTNRPAFLTATPLLFMWMVSPHAAYQLGRSTVPIRTPLSDDQRRQLRRLARRTWLYFEQFVGPDDHWLPPDHFQESPRGLVAHRTSPTNIGLLLLSTLAAYDLGYIGPLDLVLRLRPTLESMGRLAWYRGHFLNWYDTRDLRPLTPRYVSTVDSGNLAGCLVVLGQGLLALPGEPVLHWQRWQGLLDTLDVLDEVVAVVEEEATAASRSQEAPAGSLSDYVARATALKDHLADMRQQVLAVKDVPHVWASLLIRLRDDAWRELERLLVALIESDASVAQGESHVLDAAVLGDLRAWSERVYYQLTSIRSELDMLLPWVVSLSQSPALFAQPDLDSAIADAWAALLSDLPITTSLAEVPAVCRTGRARLDHLQALLTWALRDSRAAEGAATSSLQILNAGSVGHYQQALDWCVNLAEALDSARMTTHTLLISFQDLGQQAEAHFRAMDFGFLFDSHRQVFHIGYNVEAEALDSNHYDLLASESRIASLLAVAKGDVPQSHWMHLGRPVTQVNGARALLSWSGTSFEYLMPPLLMRDYEGSLLEQTYQAVIDRQIAYARQKGVPWGISESGYYRFDANLNYQYRGFGVPGLGFRRGLGEDLVISPYASLLALSLRPQAVVRNIAHLVELHMLGRYGLYEAIDYTEPRLSSGQDSAIVRSYMVHHHGMSLLALTNYLQDEAMVRRFHADPRVQSVQLLLQEQVPHQAPVEYPHPGEVRAIQRDQLPIAIAPWRVPVDSLVPQVHLLSSGRYSVIITGAGGGYSSWQRDLSSDVGEAVSAVEGIALTRWRADTTLDDWGTWIYVKDLDSGALWSVGYQPTGIAPESQEVRFYPYKAEFLRRDHDITLRMEVAVPPDDDVEIRHITLTNHSDRPRRLLLTSYGEVVLAPQSGDRRHPAFNKLFIESEYLPDVNALLFHRRPRSAKEAPVYLAHLLVVGHGQETIQAYEGDRARFLGRGRTVRSPLALTDGQGLSGTVGATLDPIMALGQEVVIEPHTTVRTAYVTLAAGSRQEAVALARRYQAWPRVRRVFDYARSHSALELHRLNLSTSELERVQQLLSVLLYPHAALRTDPATLAANSRGQPGLWAYAISGDYPIVLVRVRSEEETDLVRELLQAHAYWRGRQIKVDLVILNERDTTYEQELHGQLHRLIARLRSDTWLNQRGGVFVLRADQMGKADRTLLEAAARVVLKGSKGPLAEQLRGLHERPTRLPSFVPTLSPPVDEGLTPSLSRPADLEFDNGLGGFSADGREYVIYLEPGRSTPTPWINVIANPDFGCLVSEAGLGYTWAGNSGENRLTPWRNDPVTDTPSEALYLRDEEVGHIWSPTILPAGAPVPYLVRHGVGYSVFEHNSHGLKQRLRVFVVPDAPVKVVQLRLENAWDRNRRITATYYVEWVLGPDRDVHQQHVLSEFDAGSLALLARNPYNEEFGERVSFLAASKEPHSLTADRAEFLGRMGGLRRPAALDRVGLSGVVRAGADPCASLQIHIYLPPRGAKEVYFLLGQGADRQETLRLVGRYRDFAQVEAAWEAVHESWDRLLGAVSVRTPDQAMNLLLNHWLLYQALACRLWGRSALYQSSGAFGYRDQLQDVMALVHAAPDIVRDHILKAARHQFEAGDVLHWWHPPSGRGVRTRCSDDLLWLPFVTAYYVTATGDRSIMDEQVPFLRGDPLKEGEDERYGYYETADEVHALYEHCLRALNRGMTAGSHGLPLIGSHDWNDGFSRVGIEGRGESVWLGWFLHVALTRFAPLCERMGDEEQAHLYRQWAQDLAQALEDSGWDGQWYRRAYYDDGTPLGSAESEECQIDSIAQSWAALSGAADPERAERAMDAAAERLVRPEDQLMLLFTPPFDKTDRDPGYIKGYLPGIRENGGQYTHAALWAVWAFAELGQGDRAGALFRLLNPICHGDTLEKALRYRVEPYVVAADVYGAEPHVGRGGWTWYTGSAGWMYRLGLEGILGLHRVGGTLHISPCIPKDWSGYELTYLDGASCYRIRVENPGRVNRGVRRVTLDGNVLPGGDIPLLGDGRRHEVLVLMG